MHFQPPCWRTIELFAASRRGRVKDVFPELTKRGHGVLDLIAAGRGNADIGGELALRLRTVRDHGTIFTRLQVAGWVRGIVRAGGAGLGG
ncbi:MAG: LuxR C-terminal-related transcriptional regulator [Streptosporangiaceae bacterium]